MKKWMLNSMIGVAVIGFLAFFPVNLGNHYTCLYHRVFEPEHDYCPIVAQHAGQHAGMAVHGASSEEFLKYYIHTYGWIWWLSSGALLLIVLWKIRLNKKELI